MRSTSDTLSLSWLPPEKPNGVILDYEIKYHERVSADFLAVTLMEVSLCLTEFENLLIQPCTESNIFLDTEKCNLETIICVGLREPRNFCCWSVYCQFQQLV